MGHQPSETSTGIIKKPWRYAKSVELFSSLETHNRYRQSPSQKSDWKIRGNFVTFLRKAFVRPPFQLFLWRHISVDFDQLHFVIFEGYRSQVTDMLCKFCVYFVELRKNPAANRRPLVGQTARGLRPIESGLQPDQRRKTQSPGRQRQGNRRVKESQVRKHFGSVIKKL